MQYDISGVISARLAHVRSVVSSRAAEIKDATGLSFSTILRNSVVDGAKRPLKAQKTSNTETAKTAQPVSDALASTSTLAIQAGNRYNVNPNLIQALIWAESGGNADAVSKAGAIGLMQLMPFTAEGLGVTDPFDPKQNVDAGTRLLSSLLKRYNDDTKLALAAYNMGVSGLRRTGVTSIETDHDLSLLPSETRSLLERVSQYMDESGIAVSH